MTGVPAVRPVSWRLPARFGADLRGFEEVGEPAFGDSSGGGDFKRPAAVGDVEQQRAAGFLHVDGVFAGEAEADVVLGAEDVRGAGEDLRLVFFDPEELGQREIGQSRVAGELDEAVVADGFGEPVALGLGARVAPDQGRAQDDAVFVEQNGAVHLAGEADSGDGLVGVGCGRDSSTMAMSAARHQSSGSCSAQPGCGVRKGACSSDAELTTRPCSSTSTARVPLVPWFD
jgi:hypothetical protein